MIIKKKKKSCYMGRWVDLAFFFPHCRKKAAEWSSDDETKELNAAAPALTPTERVQTEGTATAPCHSYKKSLRLSSNQIVRPLMSAEKASALLFVIKHRRRLRNVSLFYTQDNSKISFWIRLPLVWKNNCFPFSCHQSYQNYLKIVLRTHAIIQKRL